MSIVMPEQTGTATAFYNNEEALRYSTCLQTNQLQRELTEAALHLLNLPVGTNLILLFCYETYCLRC